MSSFIRSLDFPPETGKVVYTYFQTKIAKMTVKMDQSHWRWHKSVGHISFSTSGLSNHVSILYRFWDTQRRVMACTWNLGQGRSLKMEPFNGSYTISHQSGIVSILYHFRDIWRWRISWPWTPVRGHSPCEFMYDLYTSPKSTDRGLSSCRW